MSEAPKTHFVKTSKYTTSVATTIPHDEYPRPMLERSAWTNLNGPWEYAVRPTDVIVPERYDGTILVPFCIESPLSGVERPLLPDMRLWYRRHLECPRLLPRERMILHFEAVDYIAETFVNGRFAGRHVGGYLPFSHDITELVVPGDNELVVVVRDPTDTGSQERGKQVLQPHGIWYTATSGIWQTVWMEIVDEVHVTELTVHPDYDGSAVTFELLLSRPQGADITLRVTQPDGTMVGEAHAHDGRAVLALPRFRPWSPEDPFLYDVRAIVRIDGVIQDEVTSHFGMRKIAVVRDDRGIPRIRLNDRDYFQSGVLDQGYWPDGLLTAPTDTALVDDILAMKRLGFNMLRKHIKVESRRWYWHCDRLGMLVWQDLPSGGQGALDRWLGAIRPYLLPWMGIDDGDHARFGRADAESRSRFMDQLEGTITLLSGHPSVVCWVPFNEGWGQFDSVHVAEQVRQLDPTRLVDHASGWYDRGGGDLVSVHRYVFKVRAPRPESRRAFVLSEYGGYSRLVPGHVWNPEGAFGYRMYESADALADAYAALHRDQILPLVEKGLAATIYTQLSDVELEVNGLLTYDREVLKIDPTVVQEWNRMLRGQKEKRS